jgi:hypothetical protein
MKKSSSMTNYIMKYVRFSWIDDYFRVGWMLAWGRGLTGTPHGHWSALMEWRCDCEPVFPDHVQESNRQ